MNHHQQLGPNADLDPESWPDSQDDLTLAAELGKALLERNRDLEAQLHHYQQVASEQNSEIEFVTRQLEALREVTDSRMRIYEELDRNTQELEKTNRRLLIESRDDKERIELLSSTVEDLERRYDDIHHRLDEAHALERRRQKAADVGRKTRSVPSIQDAISAVPDLRFQGWTYVEQFRNLPLNPYEAEIRKLQESTQHLKNQVGIERKKRENGEIELATALQDQQTLQFKLHELGQELVETQIREKEIGILKAEAASLCRLCGADVHSQHARRGSGALNADVEHDDPELKSEGKFARLGDGGSVYGSDESINKVVQESGEVAPDADATENVSILNELGAQYTELISKYESLISNMAKRASGDFDDDTTSRQAVSKLHKEVQTLLQQNRSTSEAEVSALQIERSKTSPPYKVLFKDLYATLKKPELSAKSLSPDSEHPGTSLSNGRNSYLT